MNKKIGVLIIALSALTGYTTACTTFTAVVGKTVLLAGNEDQTSNSSYLVVDQTGKYGAVFFATPLNNISLVMQMGINEMGLAYDINAIPSEKLIQIPNSIPQKDWALVALMKEVGSVNELLEKFFTYDWGTAIAYQIHVADRSGDAAVIHPGQDGKLTYTRIDKAKGYLVSANFNLRDVSFYKHLPGRYRTANNELRVMPSAPELTKEFMASVLDKTHQEKGWIDPTRSIFSVVFNLTELEVAFYYESKFDKPYVLGVKKALSTTYEKKIIPLPDVMSSIGRQ